jgi:hypothetical protein
LGCFFCVRKEGRKRRIKKEVVGPKTRKARSVLYYKLFYTIMIHTTSITAKLLLLQASCPMLLLASGYLASHSLLRFLISIATPKRNIKRKGKNMGNIFRYASSQGIGKMKRNRD